jgi:ubiquinone/menaquinone biosynthesis C-methylase UbiE
MTMKSRRLITRGEAAALDLPSRIRIERDITDAKARQYTGARPEIKNLDAYVCQSPWRQWMFAFLGPVRGKIVLDLGCGYHPTSMYLADAGARTVLACDISSNAVAHILKLAEERGVRHRVKGVVCAAEQLPFADEYIDLIHGEAVLHHLSMPLAAKEVARVLRPGGKAAFKDPLGQNVLLEFARDHFKHSAKATDRPLTFAQLREFARTFRFCTYRGFGLSAPIATLLGRRTWRRVTRATDILDRLILRVFPRARRYCQYVVTCAQK